MRIEADTIGETRKYMMKKLKWIAIVIVLLVVVGIVILYASLDGIIKSVVESQGTQQLKVATTLESVNLSLLHGTLNLNNFAIASPSGFSAPQMMSLGGLAVDTGGVMQLRNKPIHIPSINIDQPKLVIEQSGGKLNFKALMDQLSPTPSNAPAAPASGGTAVSPDAAAPAAAGGAEAAGGASGVRLVIDDLTMAGASVVVRPGIPGLADEIDVPIPTFDVKNIGNADGNQNGAAIKDVVSTIITALVSKTGESDKVPAQVKMLLNGSLTTANVEGAVKNEASNVVQQLQSGKKLNAKSIESGFLNQLGGSTSQPSK
jgi:AsmA family